MTAIAAPSIPHSRGRAGDVVAPGRPPAAEGGCSPELELLTLCARVRLNEREADRVRAAARAPLDWDRLLRLARWHRLLPLLHRQLAIARADVPAPVTAALRQAFVANAGRMLERCRQLVDVLDHLRASGIEAVAYKGPALAVQVYGNVALRMSGDLDVVVRPADALRAREVLMGLGYRARHPIAAEQLPYLLRHRYSEEFAREGGAVVELHWAFTNGDVAFPLSLDGPFARAEQVPLGGRSVSTFGIEDLVGVLAVHGAKHRWHRLEWAATYARLLAQVPGAAWDGILTAAGELRCRRRLLLGAALARHVGGISLSGHVEAAVSADPRSPRLVAEIVREEHERTGRAERFEQGASLPHDWMQLRLSDRVQDQFRLLGFRLTTPTRADQWRTRRIGSRLWPLHVLTRPVHAGLRLVPAVWWIMARKRQA